MQVKIQNQFADLFGGLSSITKHELLLITIIESCIKRMSHLNIGFQVEGLDSKLVSVPAVAKVKPN